MDAGTAQFNLPDDGNYTLRVEVKDKAENIVLQEVPFNILQFMASHKFSARPRVLVWNTLSPTGSPSSADATAFVNAALGSSTLLMKIDAAQADFEKDFRSGGYNVYVVLTDGAWLTSQIVKEMTESLNLGDGLSGGSAEDAGGE